MDSKTIEDYLLDLINQKFAKRVFSVLATEHERLFLDKGKDPEGGEYKWMRQRALELIKDVTEEMDT